MKIVRNTSMQGLNIPFGTPKGPISVFLAPKQSVEVPDIWRSRVAENLANRRMLRIINVIDKPTLIKTSPTRNSPTRKQTRKSK